jgi:HlyD family secretion protein
VFIIWKKIKQYKRWIVLIIITAAAAAAAAGWYAYSVQKSTKATLVQPTVLAGRGDVEATVSATGTISAVNSVDISSRVTGLIKELRVKENDYVNAGQVLVVLDDTSLRAQVAQYQAQLANYGAMYERSQKLFAIGGESAQQLDSDRTNYLVAKSNYDNFSSQLDYYVITAPIDGMVVGKPTPAGQTVAQGISTPQVIMNIADMSRMQIKVMVDETDIGKVKAGQTVSFTVDAYSDKTFTGKVTSISRSATTTSNVVYYPVYVDVDDTAGLLFPTMTARVTLHVGESRNVLVVPLAAVKEDKGQKYIQVMVNGKAENMPVQVGIADDEKIEIQSGIQEGDPIILPTAKKVMGTKEQGPPPPL